MTRRTARSLVRRRRAVTLVAVATTWTSSGRAGAAGAAVDPVA